jgi:hypothetical protein
VDATDHAPQQEQTAEKQREPEAGRDTKPETRHPAAPEPVAPKVEQTFSDWMLPVLEVWKPAMTGAPQQGDNALHLPVVGGTVSITQQEIGFHTADSETPSPEAMRAAMAELWGGKAEIPLMAKPDGDARLMQHAYALVYGVELTHQPVI